MAEVLATVGALKGDDLDLWRGAHWYNAKADRRDDFDPTDPDNDQGVIEETDEGLRFLIHPAALLPLEPKILGTISRWNAGLRELGREDYRDLSAYELAAKRTMAAAAGRALKAPGGGHGGA